MQWHTTRTLSLDDALGSIHEFESKSSSNQFEIEPSKRNDSNVEVSRTPKRHHRAMCHVLEMTP